MLTYRVKSRWMQVTLLYYECCKPYMHL